MDSTIIETVDAAIERKDFGGAAKLLRPLATRRCTDARVFARLGECESELERYDVAVAAYRCALQLDADDQESRYCLADALLRQGDYVRAMRQLDGADPDYDPRRWWYVRGLILQKQERFVEAEQAHRRGLELVPDDYYNLRGLGLVYKWTERWPQMLETFKRLVELTPTDAFAQGELGFAYGVLKRYPEALTHYRLAIKLDGDFVWSWIGLSLALEGLGQIAEARQALVDGFALDVDLMYPTLAGFDERHPSC